MATIRTHVDADTSIAEAEAIDSRPSSACSWHTAPWEPQNDGSGGSISSDTNAAFDYTERDSTRDPASEDVSNTSSYTYEHEPWMTFSKRAEEYASQAELPLEEAEKKVELGRLKGGSYNRVAALTIRHDFVIRWPRWYHDRVGAENAILKFVKLHTDIPVPRVVTFDDTQNNQFTSPYSVHQRLSGSSLCSVWCQLSHESKVKIARDVGHYFAEMTRVESGHFGRVNFDRRLPERSPVAFAFEPFHSQDVKDMQYLDDPDSAGRRLHESLIHIFDSYRARYSDDDCEYQLDPHLLEGFAQMTRDLQADGYLDGPFCILHGDFNPYNLLVDTKSCAITGVLDWDFACLVPRPLADPPPMWLWAWREGDPEDLKLANETPVVEENREVKSAFEEAAGRDYLRFAYDPKCRLARQLLSTAMQFGPHFGWSREFCKDAVDMLKEWSDLGGSDVKYWERVEDDLVELYCGPPRMLNKSSC